MNPKFIDIQKSPISYLNEEEERRTKQNHLLEL